MSRALRRQPLIQKPPAKGQAFRPAGARPSAKKANPAAAAEAAKHLSFYDRWVPKAVRDVVSELRKVTWPTREETMRLTVAVVVVSIVIGLALGGIDIGFNFLVDHTLLRK
ncbi:MAG TPA: preprotein translocase subunit SecE [Dehalococcoidia bacterium]|nr:preprotein translocase subunit SecE [Dehalococcoidia bacterium]